MVCTLSVKNAKVNIIRRVAIKRKDSTQSHAVRNAGRQRFSIEVGQKIINAMIAN
jgi:hypothetical protein